MSKIALRQQKILQRKRLSFFKRWRWNQQIFNFASQWILKQIITNKLVAIYYSNKVEVKTHKMIRFLLKNHFQVVLPAINKDHQMVFRQIPSWQFSKERVHGFDQPSSIYKIIPPNQIMLFFVPLVGFDQQRNRLGYGSGYYDRYLQNCPQALTVGLAYTLQECPMIPSETHDIKLAKIITNKGIF